MLVSLIFIRIWETFYLADSTVGAFPLVCDCWILWVVLKYVQLFGSIVHNFLCVGCDDITPCVTERRDEILVISKICILGDVQTPVHLWIYRYTITLRYVCIVFASHCHATVPGSCQSSFEILITTSVHFHALIILLILFLLTSRKIDSIYNILLNIQFQIFRIAAYCDSDCGQVQVRFFHKIKS